METSACAATTTHSCQRPSSTRIRTTTPSIVTTPVWGTASTKSAGDTYTCELNDKTHESAIFSETGGGEVAICVEVGQRVLMSDGTHKNVEQLVPGDVLRTLEGTTVRSRAGVDVIFRRA